MEEEYNEFTEGPMKKDAIMKTPLYNCHVSLGGKMVEFGGWYMPVQYSGIKEEHHVVRNSAGLFDVCHMGQIIVRGKDALGFVQRVSTNNASRLKNGQIQYSFLCNKNGGVLDDFLLYRITENDYLFLVSASNTNQDYMHLISATNGEKVSILNISYNTGMITVQGPMSLAIMEKLFLGSLEKLNYYHFGTYKMYGEEMIISRTGYTGEDGFEILCKRDDVLYLWNDFLQIGKPFGLIPCGLGARDTLRLEAGMPLHGHELDINNTPVEAGLGKYIGFDKEEDFLGKDVFLEQRKNGTKRKLIKFIMEGNRIARNEYEIYSGDELIGMTTSGIPPMTIDRSIGMGYVNAEYSEVDSEIMIRVRNDKFLAKIVKSFLKK